jgi:hypothetical protein
MNGTVSKSAPKFPPASREVIKAVRTVKAAYLAHALRNRDSPEEPFVPTPEFDAASQMLFDETHSRLDRVYKHYGLYPNDPQAAHTLVLRLACDLIPNFDPYYIPARGRPKSVLSEHGALVIEIEALQEEDKRRSLIAACRILVKRPGPWKDKRPVDLEAAYYRFYEAQGPIIDLLQGGRERAAAAVTVPEDEA